MKDQPIPLHVRETIFAPGKSVKTVEVSGAAPLVSRPCIAEKSLAITRPNITTIRMPRPMTTVRMTR